MGKIIYTGLNFFIVGKDNSIVLKSTDGTGTSWSETDIDTQLVKFKDNESIDSWARNSAAACVKLGILVGDNCMLTPDDYITRAQAATTVMRMLQKANLI